MKKKIVILDGLCMSPYYDYYLIKGIEKIEPDCYLFSDAFKNDIELFKDIKMFKILDIAWKLKVSKGSIAYGFRAVQYIMNLFLLSFYIFTNKISILHIQWLPLLKYFKLELIFLSLWKKMSKVKIVYTTHNILPHDTGNKHFDTFKKVYDLADKLICHVNITKQELQDRFNIQADKIEVIPHGPLFEDFDIKSKESACESLQLHNVKNVLILGYIRPYKGIDFLVDTWKEVIKEEPEAQLIICGKANKESEDEIRAKIDTLGLNDNVVTRFKFVDTEEVPLYHFAADIIVFPYKRIDQSGALYTAMAAGKPIITTNVGGFKEVIIDGENGYLVEYGDTRDFTEKIIHLLNDKNKKENMGEVNYNLIKSQYSWKVIAESTVKVYN
jgi:glycosyltransferase involved in cell wall biosynthesis